MLRLIARFYDPDQGEVTMGRRGFSVRRCRSGKRERSSAGIRSAGTFRRRADRRRYVLPNRAAGVPGN
ncbi:hypothetical protein PV433_04310 [Paenibacillus sp. GYB004]|uniref:hypothetical protein n=1 Tax=Paenibacillus sp. GYB004 TaxID=2994393 RepID=UPI002FC13155